MEQSAVVNVLSQLLDEEKYKEALCLPEDVNYVDSFTNNPSDLISIILEKIYDDTIVCKPSLQTACERLLLAITKKASPELVLLDVLEQIENATNDARFIMLLNPLQYLLNTLITRRSNSLEWSLRSLNIYVESIPLPNYQLDSQERLLIDSDLNARRVVKIYYQLPIVYEGIVTELNKHQPSMKAENMKHLKQVMAAFLIRLLGKPLIYIDLDPEINGMGEVTQSCIALIQNLQLMEKDLVKFLLLIPKCLREKDKTEDQEHKEKSPYNKVENINMITLSGMFYVIYSGHFSLPDISLPQVYATECITYHLMQIVVHLLTYVEYGPLSKGLSLFKVVLNNIDYPAPYSLLSTSIYNEICKNITTVTIYSSFESIRKNALSLLNIYINKFEYKGRYTLIKYLIDMANHSGMIGYAITLFKNNIDEAFKTQNAFPECFKGASFEYMLKKICYLPFGAQSDLIEHADQIITCINFLRYITVKDVNNVTGIKESLTFIENDYLTPLRTGLNMSKAHYEERLKSLENEKNANEVVSVNVAGKLLDNVPTESKKQIIFSALNAFHLMEGLIARYIECIHLSKSDKCNI